MCVGLPERHPITNAIDGTNRWWQSPSIKNGRQFHWVTITLDLQQVSQLVPAAALLQQLLCSPGLWSSSTSTEETQK